MPSKFPWGKSKGSKKSDKDAADDTEVPSPSRHGSVATTLDYPGSNPDNYYRGGSNYEHPEIDDYTQHSIYQHNPTDRTAGTPSLSLPDTDNEADEIQRGQFHFPPASPPPAEGSTRKTIRDRLGLSSSRENVSEDEDKAPREHHRRDEFRSKLGFGRRSSVRHKASPSSSQPDLLQVSPPPVPQHTWATHEQPDDRLIHETQEPKLPSIAQNDDYLASERHQQSYEPSPVIPQEQNRPPAYLAYRAPGTDSSGHTDYPQSWAEDAVLRQQQQQQQQHHQRHPIDQPQGPRQYDQRDRPRSSQHHQGVPVYEQPPDDPSQPPYGQAIPYQDREQLLQQQQQLQQSNPVSRPQEFVAPADKARRQDSIRRQSSVLRKTVQPVTSLRGHRKTQSSEAQTAVVAAATPALQVPLQAPRDGTAKNPGGMSPNPVQQPSGISRSNTQMQQSQENDGTAARAAGDMSPDQVEQLMTEYRELREKYSKVKRYYFEKDDQVKQLQNTLAHQRLSQSRTSLDDGEYIQRFTRLDGLISQLAFGFRKDWKAVPQWLQPHVNKDAISIGKQEMTAVGRAFISRWLADEVFDKYFSPALNPTLSVELKSIQKNIRAFHPAFQTTEEEEALTAKIINWRLATVDGLQHVLTSADAANNKKHLVEMLSQSLITDIQEYMSAPPVGLEGGVHMIIELAVAILANLPFESRDVHIEYILPGSALGAELMKIETGIPPLAVPISGEVPASDSVSIRSTTDSTSDMQADEAHNAPDTADKPEKKSFLGGLMGDRKKGGNNGAGLKHSSATNSQTSLAPPGSSGGSKEAGGDGSPRVRLCVFLGLEIRGKMVLAKAPVYRA